MTPATRLDIPVEVLVDARWHEGFLEHWRQRHGTWQGYCRWSQGTGAQYIRWLDQDHIRQQPGDDNGPFRDGA